MLNRTTGPVKSIVKNTANLLDARNTTQYTHHNCEIFLLRSTNMYTYKPVFAILHVDSANIVQLKKHCNNNTNFHQSNSQGQAMLTSEQ